MQASREHLEVAEISCSKRQDRVEYIGDRICTYMSSAFTICLNCKTESDK